MVYVNIFTAENDHIFNRAEETLKEHAVDCRVSLEALPEVEESNVCFQRLVLQVPDSEAERCRELLRRAGLDRGLV